MFNRACIARVPRWPAHYCYSLFLLLFCLTCGLFFSARLQAQPILAPSSSASSSVPASGEPALVVTATRFALSPQDSPPGLSVITADRIANSSASSLPELLSREAGIVTRDSTGSPDAQIDMRGFGVSGDQNTLLLLNGQRLNEIELVSQRWSAIPLESIERIEILRGGGAVLYGGNATGGTINIITRAPQAGTRSANVSLLRGSLDTQELRAGYRAASDRLGLSLDLSDHSSDNYRLNNQLSQKNLAAEVRAFGDRSHLAFNVGLENQNLRLPGERTMAQLASDPRGTSRPSDYSGRDGTRAGLSGQTALAGDAELAADLGWRSTVRNSLQKDYSGAGSDTYTESRSHAWSFTPRLKLPLHVAGVKHNFILGVDMEDVDYGARRAAGLAMLSAPLTNVDAAQTTRAFYVQDRFALNADSQLTLGARQQRVITSARDRMNAASYASGSKTSSPRAWEMALRSGLGGALGSGISVFGRVGESFRTTTIDESYSQYGSASFDSIVTLLEPQTSRDHEIGLDGQSGSTRWRASTFVNYLNNEIHYFAPTFTNINLPPTRRAGIELDGSVQAHARLVLRANLSLNEARFRSGVIGTNDVSSKHIPLVPRETLNVSGEWRIEQRWMLAGSLRHVGKQYYDNDQTNTFPTRMPAYEVVDLKLMHDMKGGRVSLLLNNLFDKQYYSYGIRNTAGTSFNAYPQRPRTLMLGLELSI